MVDMIRDIPLFWAKIIAVMTFGGGILWTWLRPKKFIFQDAPDMKLWRDLRIWITIVMVCQIAIYLYF